MFGMNESFFFVAVKFEMKSEWRWKSFDFMQFRIANVIFMLTMCRIGSYYENKLLNLLNERGRILVGVRWYIWNEVIEGSDAFREKPENINVMMHYYRLNGVVNVMAYGEHVLNKKKVSGQQSNIATLPWTNLDIGLGISMRFFFFSFWWNGGEWF